jgi:ABC-type nickel/cobalt efflux system permease component RcnA
MTRAIKKSLLVVALFGISTYCVFTAVMMAQLAPYPAPRSSHITFYLFAAGFLLFLGLGLWQLISLLRRHGSENLL